MTTATALHERPRPAPRTLRSDLRALRSRAETAIAEQPIAAAATAASVGFVLGARLARPAMVFLIHAGSRAAATWLGEVLRQTARAHIQDAAKQPNTGGFQS